MMETPGRQRIAVVGSGIAGLGAAYFLSRRHQVTLFEADTRPGGHTNTMEADFGDRQITVDTGFIVFNPLNYPNLCALFSELGVASEKSEMSFGVSVGGGRLEWAGSNLATLFAQPANLLRPRFHGMWRDILRFNREAPAALATGHLGESSLGDYLAAGGYGEAFILDYLLPMGAAIWSAPMAEMLRFPARSFVRFFVNHGLLQVNDRPQWRTVSGGARSYVRRLLRQGDIDLRLGCRVVELAREETGVTLYAAGTQPERFDHVVLATHADQSLRLLGDPTRGEAELLGAFRFEKNLAWLHRDARLMPKRRRVWSSWNYLTEDRRDLERKVAVTYWMNRLQNLDPACPLFVTLNPLAEPEAALTFARIGYEHPLFDEGAIRAQAALGEIQGTRRTWFCGAWTRHGFHEDGLVSAIRVARSLGAPPDFATDVAPYESIEPPITLRAAE
ncbi:MAG: FAD-dependent oxidoreductase [Alphaproteobacteria bacterium]|nr:FAD-dependent oxidoreductase [Alphaproteobacteria bacterium]